MTASKGETPRALRPFDIEAKREINGEATDRAIEYMKRHSAADNPFCAYIPLTAMHYPSLPSSEFDGKSGSGVYADLLMQTDDYVGRIAKTIDDLNICEDTIFIVTADHGVEDPGNGNGQCTGWTGPWSGTYFAAMEGGLRTPFIVRWPGKIPENTVNNEIVHLVDIFPTLASIAGISIPDDRPVEGIDMSEFFLSQAEGSGREGFLIYIGDELRALKWRNWKIHFGWAEGKYDPVERFSTVPRVVDLIRDPRQQRQAAEPYNASIQFHMTPLMIEFIRSTQ